MSDLESDLGILSLEDPEPEAPDRWLTSTGDEDDGASLEAFLAPPPSPDSSSESPSRKRSLVSRLDDLKRSALHSTPRHHFPPPLAAYLRDNQHSSSTPKTDGDSPFDSRTFTRPSKGRNTTFTAESSPGLNATFSKRPCDLQLNNTYDVSADADVDERLSNASDGSQSHRLNSVGDVQHLAKMQEESLRDSLPQHRSRKSSAFSPNSDPSTGSPPPDNGGGYHSEESEGSQQQRSRFSKQQQQQHYSSQDSLPDSPYSSQSLDSQPLSHQDRIGRSMPNLSKRGISRPATSATGSLRPAPTAAGAVGGVLPRPASTSRGMPRQNASDPYLRQQMYKAPPARGATATQRPAAVTASSNVPRPSRIARPATASNIPRPGSRLPMFQGAPRGASGGRNLRQARNWREDCY